MAIPTQFSVTSKRRSPIANPESPKDLPRIINAENQSIVDGANILASLSSAGVDSPDNITAQPSVSIDTSVTIPALPAGSIDTPDELTSLTAPSVDAPSNVSAQTQASTPAPSIITPNTGTLTTPPFPLNHARILYENKLEAYISASSNVASNAVNAIKPNTWEAWTPSGPGYFKVILGFDRGIDTICLGSHNLADGGYTVEAFYRETEGGALIPFDAGFTPTTNAPIMFHLPFSRLMRVLEVYIENGSGDARVGYISAGDALQMQRPFFNGHTPITDADVTEYYSNRTESGEIIGQQIIRQGYQTSADWSNIDDEWYRTYFAPFKQAAKLKPFFFAWNLLEYPEDIGLCRISQDIQAPMQNGTKTKRSISMNLLGAG